MATAIPSILSSKEYPGEYPNNFSVREKNSSSSCNEYTFAIDNMGLE
ncbi:Uncharacterised protein [Chlamydia trachomatis]|nr:Uncharacterised protein [Chlamydia trachomatis]